MANREFINRVLSIDGVTDSSVNVISEYVKMSLLRKLEYETHHARIVIACDVNQAEKSLREKEYFLRIKYGVPLFRNEPNKWWSGPFSRVHPPEKIQIKRVLKIRFKFNPRHLYVGVRYKPRKKINIYLIPMVCITLAWKYEKYYK